MNDGKLLDSLGYCLSVYKAAGLSHATSALLLELRERFPHLPLNDIADALDHDAGLGGIAAKSSNQASSSSQWQSDKTATAEDASSRPFPIYQRKNPAGEPVLPPASFSSPMPWGRDIEEYENAEDVGYRRKRVASQEAFIEQELDLLTSEESSEQPYSSSTHSAKPLGAAAALAAAAAAGGGGSGASSSSRKQKQQAQHHAHQPQAQHKHQQQQQLLQASSSADAATASEEDEDGDGDEPTSSSRSAPYPAFAALSGGGTSAERALGDEAWDMGPLDIKIADPVITPRKSVGARSADESKPVLSRVESLSSSFKDFDLERLDDGRCMSRGSQPSELELHSDDGGVRFHPPASDMSGDALGDSGDFRDLFAAAKGGFGGGVAGHSRGSSTDMATAASSDVGGSQSLTSTAAGSVAGGPPGSSDSAGCGEKAAVDKAAADKAADGEGEAAQGPGEVKESVGGFSFPVTPVEPVDPKPFTPWPVVRSASTNERLLESVPSPTSSQDGPPRSKLGRGALDEGKGGGGGGADPKASAQRTSSDSGVTSSSSLPLSGKDAIGPAKSAPASVAALGPPAALPPAPTLAMPSASTAEDGARSGGGIRGGAAAVAEPSLSGVQAATGAAGPGGQETAAAAVEPAAGAGIAAHRISVDDSLDPDSSPGTGSPGGPDDTSAGRQGPVSGASDASAAAASGKAEGAGDAGLGGGGGEGEGEGEEDSASLTPYSEGPPEDWPEAAADEEELDDAATTDGADVELLPKYTIDESGAIVYQYDLDYFNNKYEVFPLQIIHRRHRTGFEETKDFPIRMNDLIAGRYQVMDFLGSAAFSRAVQALDVKTNSLVCLKIVKNNKDYFDQSLDEIKLLKFVNACDPNDEHGVVRLFDYFYYKEHLFLVCELLRANLYEFQKYNKESGEELYFTNARIQKIATSVLKSLAYLHSLDLIHSDLKPENILIKSYSRCEVKVIDLGSSCFTTDQLSSYVQSRSYRAPEVILGLPYDHKVDIWSLGAILAELSSGYVLFQNDSVATLLARLEGILGPMPAWMLEKGRYANRFFTRSGHLYERTGGTASGSGAGGESGGRSVAAGSSGECYELLVPKKTSLRHRVPDADAGLLSFVSFLLAVDPRKRPSAQEALQHPWLQVKYPSLDSMTAQ